jgi:hypothetical protein
MKKGGWSVSNISKLSGERLQDIHNWEEGDPKLYDRKSLDPYRCPVCDKSVNRVDNPSPPPILLMLCPEHGIITPRYDESRAARGAAESFKPQPCGCYTESGLYTVYCEHHDPVQIIAELLEERTILLIRISELEEQLNYE